MPGLIDLFIMLQFPLFGKLWLKLHTSEQLLTQYYVALMMQIVPLLPKEPSMPCSVWQ